MRASSAWPIILHQPKWYLTKYKFKSILNMCEILKYGKDSLLKLLKLQKNKSVIIGNIYRPPPNTNAICQTSILL